MDLLPVALDLIGIFVFALSGALLGVRIRFDIVGVLVLGAVTGLGLFSVLGTQKAIIFGLDPIPAALMGILTGVGGGVLRDLLANRMPVVLREDVYVLPSLAGSLVVVITWELGLFRDWVLIPAAALCILLRFLAIRFRWSAPRATDW